MGEQLVLTSRPLQAPAMAQAPLEPSHRGSVCPSDFSAEMDLLGTGAWGFSINTPFQVCRRTGRCQGCPLAVPRAARNGARALCKGDRNGPGNLARLRAGVAPCGDFPSLIGALPVTLGPAAGCQAGCESRRSWTKPCCRRPLRRPRQPRGRGANTEPSLSRPSAASPESRERLRLLLLAYFPGYVKAGLTEPGAAARAAELLPVPAGSGG